MSFGAFPFPFPAPPASGPTPEPGDRPNWTTYEWMQRVASATGGLKRASEADGPGFQLVREDATADLIRLWTSRYRIRPGFVRRQGQFDPIFGDERPDPTLYPSVPTAAQFAAALATDAVTLDDTVRKAIAHRAASQVYARQTNQNLDREAEYHREQADGLLKGYRIRIEVDGQTWLVASSGGQITLVP